MQRIRLFAGLRKAAARRRGVRRVPHKDTAVERTFVQFYPTLLDVARKMKTVKPGF